MKSLSEEAILSLLGLMEFTDDYSILLMSVSHELVAVYIYIIHIMLGVENIVVVYTIPIELGE